MQQQLNDEQTPEVLKQVLSKMTHSLEDHTYAGAALDMALDHFLKESRIDSSQHARKVLVNSLSHK